PAAGEPAACAQLASTCRHAEGTFGQDTPGGMLVPDQQVRTAGHVLEAHANDGLAARHSLDLAVTVPHHVRLQRDGAERSEARVPSGFEACDFPAGLDLDAVGVCSGNQLPGELA